LSSVKLCELAETPPLVVVVGGIGREVRGGVRPVGVFVSPTATGAGALLQPTKSAIKSSSGAPVEMAAVVHRRR
jgi:hypothetical protein